MRMYITEIHTCRQLSARVCMKARNSILIHIHTYIHTCTHTYTQTNCQPALVCQHAVEDARRVCEMSFGTAPEVILCMLVYTMYVYVRGCDAMSVYTPLTESNVGSCVCVCVCVYVYARGCDAISVYTPLTESNVGSCVCVYVCMCMCMCVGVMRCLCIHL